jgi:hypothetical protein
MLLCLFDRALHPEPAQVWGARGVLCPINAELLDDLAWCSRRLRASHGRKQRNDDQKKGNRMKLLVFTNPKSERDDEYNEWYSKVHLKDLLDIPGVVGAQRYRLRPMGGPSEPAYGYLAIYELQGDLESVMYEMSTRAGTEQMMISDALDIENILMGAYEEM